MQSRNREVVVNSEVAGEREMSIVGFAMVSQQTAQVGLQEKGGTRLCALHCDVWSGLGIEQAWRSQTPDQPHQQDLLKIAFCEGGICVVGVLLMSGTQTYLWGRLFLRQGERSFTMDCRAACAIGQAIRWNVPIMMDELVLQAANRCARSGSVTSAEPTGRPS